MMAREIGEERLECLMDWQRERERERELEGFDSMASRKRRGHVDGEQATVAAEAVAARVTRSSTSRLNGSDVAAPPQPEPKKRNNKKARTAAPAKGEGEPAPVAEVADGGSKTRTIVIEHCKQCNSFKTRAVQVKNGLEKGVPGITVHVNPEKPRRGCFEIREEGGEKFITLLDMKRPFKPMKELDMDKVISVITDKVK